jgi:aminoglycoside phosphotransferase (APT) family kinase protein
MADKISRDIQSIANHFQVPGRYDSAELVKRGHINETYLACYIDQRGAGRYILQRINHEVFKDPVSLMENLQRVTDHLRQKIRSNGSVGQQTLTLVPARGGQWYHRDDAGNFWRTFHFLEGVQSFESVHEPDQAYEAGNAFGRFQKLLVDLPGTRLSETIPDFHDATKRFAALEAAVQRDACNRAQGAKKEIEFAWRLKPIASQLKEAQVRGEIPERVTHNDTKFNNVMLDAKSGRAVCVVDLDTVMPGLVHYDFGDMVRTTTSRSAEDERDLSKISLEMPMFQALARGYLEAAGDFLTKSERSYLAFSGKLITFTIGIRFLTDYLCGDHYFRIHRPSHNLDRCRTQFKLIESICRQEEEMQRFIDRIAGCG